MNKIKVLLYAVLTLVLGMALSSCSDDDGIPTVTPSASGTFTDADGTVYHWVRIGTLDWMVENYKGAASQGLCPGRLASADRCRLSES